MGHSDKWDMHTIIQGKLLCEGFAGVVAFSSGCVLSLITKCEWSMGYRNEWEMHTNIFSE